MLLQLFQLLIHLFVYPSKHFRIRSIHILYVRCFREYFQNCSQFFRSNAWKSFLRKMQTIIYFCNSLRIIVNVTVIVNLGIWQQTKDSFSIIVLIMAVLIIYLAIYGYCFVKWYSLTAGSMFEKGRYPHNKCLEHHML